MKQTKSSFFSNIWRLVAIALMATTAIATTFSIKFYIDKDGVADGFSNMTRMYFELNDFLQCSFDFFLDKVSKDVCVMYGDKYEENMKFIRNVFGEKLYKNLRNYEPKR